MESSIIGCVREYISTCPLLKGGYININRLEIGKTNYTIDEQAAQPIVKMYTDGSSLRQFLFIFASSEDLSMDAVENLKACGFYEGFSNWLDKQTQAGNLPELPKGCEAQKVQATTNGYSFQTNEEQKSQRYQIQCRLTYLKG